MRLLVKSSYYIVPNLSITLLYYGVSGDTVNHVKSKLFVWEAGAKGLASLVVAISKI